MKFLLTIFPGLSKLASSELGSRMKLLPVASARVRGSEILWVQTTNPAGLLELKLIEDVFIEIDTIKLTGKSTDLKLITATLMRADTLETALRTYVTLTNRTLPTRSHFRVVAQADDAAWREYRRVDMQSTAEMSLARARPNWRLDPVAAPVEIWLHQIGRQLSVSLRLTNGLHRARGGREAERAAALRPTIAAAMVYAAGLGDEDVFLDPMCGTGTILLERAQAGRHGLLLGGDIDPAAVKAAQANFGPRHKPVRIEQMDARRLPLEDSSVNRFVTNLPWGQQIGTLRELPKLYAGVLAEAVRVVQSGGTIVLLSSERELLKRACKAQSKIKLIQTVPDIEVLGRRAEMVVLHRI